jgi:hypothetical protein
MKKESLSKVIASALLLLILTMSATATAASGKKNTITASAGPNGTIDPSGEVRVKPGDPQTFTFDPYPGYHVSAIVVDGVYESSFAESYTFANIKGEYHTIAVSFSADGEATVPKGSGVTIFVNPAVFLTLDVTASGVATGTEQSFPPGTSVAVWEIDTTAGFDGEVIVALQYDDSGLTEDQEKSLRLIRGDSLDAVYSDVNNDLVVDGTDVSIVANANKLPDPEGPNLFLDVNNDGAVNEDDVHVVNGNIGTTLKDITWNVNATANIIYGITDHFSLFRAH